MRLVGLFLCKCVLVRLIVGSVSDSKSVYGWFKNMFVSHLRNVNLILVKDVV